MVRFINEFRRWFELGLVIAVLVLAYFIFVKPDVKMPNIPHITVPDNSGEIKKLREEIIKLKEEIAKQRQQEGSREIEEALKETDIRRSVREMEEAW